MTLAEAKATDAALRERQEWAERLPSYAAGLAGIWTKLDEERSALMAACPHGEYVHGGSMGDVCVACGAMRDHE
jgi:hypothetical protein